MYTSRDKHRIACLIPKCLLTYCQASDHNRATFSLDLDELAASGLHVSPVLELDLIKFSLLDFSALESIKKPSVPMDTSLELQPTW